MAANQLKNKTIALTGATGFLGGHILSHLLKNNYEVKALARQEMPMRHGVTWVTGDLHNHKALQTLTSECHSVIHCAGTIKGLNEKSFFHINRYGTDNILRAASETGVGQFLHISSLAAREPSLSYYSASKAAAEHAITDKNWPFKWSIIRPPGIYGPGDMETLSLIKMVRNRLMLAPGNASNRASWIHVSDLSAALVTILKHFPASEIHEIDDGQAKGYSHKEFADTIGNIFNISPWIVSAPGFLIKAMANINGLAAQIRQKPTIFTLPKARELLHPNWIVEESHRLKLPDWQPHYDLNKGMKNTIEWYSQNGFL